MFRALRVLLLLVLSLPSAVEAQTTVEARLAWDPSASPEIAGYIVDYGTSSGAYTHSVDVGALTQYTIQGLINGKTYYFAVRAYDTAGVMSPRSNEVVYTTPAACTMDFSATFQAIGAAGGTGSFGLSTGSGCSWNVGSSADWLTLSSSNGSNSSTIDFNVAPNLSKLSRIGIIYSGYRSIIVSQSGRMKADIDNDGRNDLVWQNHATGEISVWRMSGTSIRGGEYLSPNNVGDKGWKMAGTLDADRDGQADLLFQHDNGSVAIWRMNGDTRVESVVLADKVTDTQWRIVGTGDMDTDGFEDIIWQHADGRVLAWYMDGLEKREEFVIAVVSDARWRVAAMEDFNYDGKLDILWRHTTWGQFLVWNMNNRDFVSAGMYLIMANAQWQVAAVGDFSGDGKPDLIWRNSQTGELAAWFLDGESVIEGRSLNPPRVPDTNWRIAGPR